MTLPAGLDAVFAFPDIVINTPTVGIRLCCTLPGLPSFPIILPLGLIPDIAITMQPLLAVIMAFVDLLNSLLALIEFECPLND